MMNDTAWKWRGRFIVTDLAKGNALASVIDPDDGGAETFTNGMKLRAIGSTSTTPTAWYASSLLKATGVGFVVEFQSAGPYPHLVALGITPEQIAAFKAVFTISYGLPDEIDAGALAWISAQGYEPIPVDGPFP